MTTLFTIGTKGRRLAEFIGLLREHGVDAIIDVRLKNTSHLAGYTKRDDLAFLLQEGFGIAYEHHPKLAPTAEIRSAYTKTGNWEAYEAAFADLLIERDIWGIGREILGRYRAPCLLCSEATADRCHRRLVAEHWADHDPAMTIHHL